ncbi:phenylacetyl-CoA:acceptor oxidoreductase [Thauera chlorobenzoica]|nr:phenylacetyl-CoA:acceptor oxidoreductase [Thauera chlorobenzoica]
MPLVANSAWSAALGPTHLAWMQQVQGFEHFPEPTQPEVWFFYRTNPVISFWDTPQVAKTLERFPFVVAFTYTRDETNHFADILLPDCTDLEGLQLMRIGGTKYVEQFWDQQGFALRQPAVSPQGEARDFTWITTELARRTGVLENYNKAINKGAAGVPLKGADYDYSLPLDQAHSVETIWDASCRAASAELTGGTEDHGLDWWREHGFRTIGFPRLQWYLYPHLVDHGLRFEMPYQERILRVGTELGRRLHEAGIQWWDRQLDEYRPLPEFHDFSHLIKDAVISNLGGREEDFPFWLLTSRSMQYAWGGNVSLQMVREVAANVAGHRGVIMNPASAAKLGIEDGDLIEVRSPLRATRGRVVLRQGIRPDTLLMIGQFDHWATPTAKDFKVTSMNSLVPMLLDLTDATGSAGDIVPVGVKRVGGGQ